MSKKLELIYIAGPYSAETPELIRKNVETAKVAGQEILRRGHACICPHSMTHDWDIGTGLPYEVFLETDLEILRRCDAILMLPGWSKSRGSVAEFQEAGCLGLKRYLSIEEIKVVGK